MLLKKAVARVPLKCTVVGSKSTASRWATSNPGFRNERTRSLYAPAYTTVVTVSSSKKGGGGPLSGCDLLALAALAAWRFRKNFCAGHNGLEKSIHACE